MDRLLAKVFRTIIDGVAEVVVADPVACRRSTRCRNVHKGTATDPAGGVTHVTGDDDAVMALVRRGLGVSIAAWCS